MNQNTPNNQVHHRSGFSLVEVLIAMGIFAVGFVAVAAMFPAGAILQKETVAQVEAQMVGRNAAAIVRSTRLTFSKDGLFGADLRDNSCSIDLAPFSAGGFLAPSTAATRWKLGDRSYPTAQKTIIDRKYYWVPFIRRTKPSASNKADWSVVVFVLRREASQNYQFTGTPYPAPSGTWANGADGTTVPKVIGITPSAATGNRFNFPNRLFSQTPAGVADQVRIGDSIADNAGGVYIVTDADATGCNILGGIAPLPTGGTRKLWYAPPPAPGVPSPTVRVLLLGALVSDAEAP